MSIVDNSRTSILKRFREKIETRARKLLNEGVAELQDEAWS